MMNAIINACIRRPVTVIMILSALLLGGIVSLLVLPLERLPEFPFPRVTVETLYPGLGAEDIRSVITIPVEDALSSVKGLERMRSVSRDGASLTVLDFRWGTDSGSASVLVREAIDAVYPSLPEGASKPAVIPGDPDAEAQVIVAVRSSAGSVFARGLAEYELRSMFRRIDGVGVVTLSGGDKEELAIKVDMPRAVSRGLSPSTLSEILAAETANVPAGNARQGDQELVVVSQGKPASQAELEKLILPSRNGSFVISDIGKIERTKAKKESLFIVGGTEYTALEIFRRPGSDLVKLSRDIRRTAAEAQAGFGNSAEIVIVYDDAESIIPGIQKLVVSVVLGAAAVMTVLFVTLRDFRYSLLAGLSLPLAMSASLAALAVFGRSLNNMSLSGIALGIGLVSDTSVIMLDLLQGVHEKNKSSNKVSVKTSGKISKNAFIDELGKRAASVAASSFGGTATTAVVFIPVLFLPGPLGSLFGDLSAALVVSILFGWLYAQFALPSLFGMICSTRKTPPRQTAFPRHNGSALVERYAAFLGTCLQKPAHVLGITGMICIIGLVFLLSRPIHFVSSDMVPEIEVVLNFPSGTSLDSIAAEAARLGGQLASVPEMRLVFGRAGSEKDDTARRSDPDYRKETFVFRCIVERPQKTNRVLASLDSLLEKQPYEIFARLPQDKTEKLLGLSSSFVMAVKGQSPEEAENFAAAAEERIRGEGYAALRRPAAKRSELRIVPDREALAYAGLSAAETAAAFYAAAEGLAVAELELEGKPLTVRVSALEIPPPEALPITPRQSGAENAQGTPVFAGSIADFIPRETQAALARLDRSDVVYIESSSPDGKKKELAAFLNLLCENEEHFFRLDESAFVHYKNSLLVTIVIVVILLYLTMGAEFESLSLPLLLLLAIPFSLSGAGPALLFSGEGLDSSSALALMVLFGLSVNSGMVLYELAAEKLNAGKTPEKAVYEAARERFRPVLTTTLTTVFALLPLTISPLGAKEHSMAAAMLGGITACTALTLFALPPALVWFTRRQKGIKDD